MAYKKRKSNGLLPENKELVGKTFFFNAVDSGKGIQALSSRAGWGNNPFVVRPDSFEEICLSVLSRQPFPSMNPTTT
jgi:hypothetical protein